LLLNLGFIKKDDEIIVLSLFKLISNDQINILRLLPENVNISKWFLSVFKGEKITFDKPNKPSSILFVKLFPFLFKDFK